MTEALLLRKFLNGIQLYLGSLGVVALVNGHYPQSLILLGSGGLILWFLDQKTL